MKAIGIDPSLTCTGIVALDFDAKAITAWDVIQTKPQASTGRKTDDLVRRLSELSERVSLFISEHQGVRVIEAQTASSHGRASMANTGALMASYGTIIGCLGGRKPIVIMPQVVKQRLTGVKGSSKEEAWLKAKQYFESHPSLPKSKAAREAVQDAVCVAVAALPEIQQIHDLLR